jgi:uncharacterized membrane protein HdeD (DUF308 family)
MMTPQRDRTPGSLLNWRASFTLGLITLVFGVIVTFRPTQSLNVIAVLLGVAMIASGLYHVVRAVDGREHERVWRGISGVVFILAGLALLRHLHLSVALIGLFIGFTWVIQGVMALVEAFSGGRGRGGGWSLFFGVISLVAGIVVISAPISSVTTLTIFTGIWLIVIGLAEMLGALVGRHGAGGAETGQVSVPGQRPGEARSREGAARMADQQRQETASGDSGRT